MCYLHYFSAHVYSDNCFFVFQDLTKKPHANLSDIDNSDVHVNCDNGQGGH